MVNKYCQKHKERLQKEPHKRYQNISKEEKKIKDEKRLQEDIKILLKKKKKKGISIIQNVRRGYLTTAEIII